MPEKNEEQLMPTPAPAAATEKAEIKENITCHLVTLPQIVLTRIDEGGSISEPGPFSKIKGKKGITEKMKKPTSTKKSPSKLSLKKQLDSKKSPSKLKVKKTLKSKTLSNKLNLKNSLKSKSSSSKLTMKNPLKSKTSSSKLNLKKPLKSKTSVSKLVDENKVGKRSRGKPKKLDDFVFGTFSKKFETKKSVTPTVSLRAVPERTTGAIKNLLKKATLQKKSRIIVPSTKGVKLTADKQMEPKQSSGIYKKQIPPKPKLEILQGKSADSDSSGDEFLYDELIGDLQNTEMKIGASKLSFEKTTNITLKPNEGNKPPTIVKGGIVKRTNLPPDLKSIAPLNNINPKNVKKADEPTAQKPNAANKIIKRKSDIVQSPSLSKKPSPWPISISPIKENNKSLNNLKKSTNSVNPLNKDVDKTVLTKPVSVVTTKPKIGPKQTAKVIPLSKTLSQDGNISDEYTEEEFLESEMDQVFSNKGGIEPTKNKSYKQEETKKNLTVSSSVEAPLDDEDPHLDLLRILTDDSEEHSSLQSDLNYLKENTTQSATTLSNGKIIKEQKIQESRSAETVPETTIINEVIENAHEAPNETVEEPASRTIYDLMNEFALQYPSWNLHIIPETNAFCIAQVTRGRLGLPTLKKCIELDPEDYSAKVYIHQYHIKRFDGIYDSEESILALIHEINTIRA